MEATEERFEVVDVDVTDYQALLEILMAYDVNTVFHLAAQPIVGVANRLPLSTLESNVRGAYTMLEACRTTHASGASLKSVVVASSDHAYGSHQELPYREDFGLLATYPYDASKACADMIGRCYAETYGLPVAVTRLANVYGGGDCHWSRIVPDCSRALVRGERPIIRSDGTPERDFLYVEDAVEAYLTVGLSLLED